MAPTFPKTFIHDLEEWILKQQKAGVDRNYHDFMTLYAMKGIYKANSLIEIPTFTPSGFKYENRQFTSRGSVDNLYFKLYRCNQWASRCKVIILVPKEAKAGTRLGIVRGLPHFHQRYPTEEYDDDGGLKIAKELFQAADTLMERGCDLWTLKLYAETQVHPQDEVGKNALKLFLKGRELFDTLFLIPRFLSQNKNSTVYVLFDEKFEDGLRYPEMFEHIVYVGERGTAAHIRAELNRRNFRTLARFRKYMGDSLVGRGLDLFHGLSETGRKMAETLVMGLFVGSAGEPKYRLANVKRGLEALDEKNLSKKTGQPVKGVHSKPPTYFANDWKTDALVASFLLLFGFICAETYEVDYNARTEKSKEADQALKELWAGDAGVQATKLAARIEELEAENKQLRKRLNLPIKDEHLENEDFGDEDFEDEDWEDPDKPGPSKRAKSNR